MKNTLNEILSMMSRIDPSYVYEDGEGDGQENVQITATTTNTGGTTTSSSAKTDFLSIKFAEFGDINANTPYSDDLYFPKMVEIIDYAVSDNPQHLEEIIAEISEKYSSIDLRNKQIPPERGTLANAVMISLRVILGNKDNLMEGIDNFRNINASIKSNGRLLKDDLTILFLRLFSLDYTAGETEYSEIKNEFVSKIKAYNNSLTDDETGYLFEKAMELAKSKQKEKDSLIKNIMANRSLSRPQISNAEINNFIKGSSKELSKVIYDDIIKYSGSDSKDNELQLQQLLRKNMENILAELFNLNYTIVCEMQTRFFSKNGRYPTEDELLGLLKNNGEPDYSGIKNEFISGIKAYDNSLNDDENIEDFFRTALKEIKELVKEAKPKKEGEKKLSNIQINNSIKKRAKRICNDIIKYSEQKEWKEWNSVTASEKIKRHELFLNLDGQGKENEPIPMFVDTIQNVPSGMGAKNGRRNINFSKEMALNYFDFDTNGTICGRLRSYLYFVSNKRYYSKTLREFLFGEKNCFKEGNNNGEVSYEDAKWDDPLFGIQNGDLSLVGEASTTEVLKLLKSKRFTMSGSMPELRKKINTAVSGEANLYGNKVTLFENIQSILYSITSRNKSAKYGLPIGVINTENTDFTLLVRMMEILTMKNNPSYVLILQRLKPEDVLNNISVKEFINREFDGDEKELEKILPNGALSTIYEDGEMVDATVVDFFQGAFSESEISSTIDKDKTNREIQGFCNEVSASYLVDRNIINVNNIGNENLEEILKKNRVYWSRELNGKGKLATPSTYIHECLGNLSIDIGNEDMESAIEYQGPQHYMAEGKTSPISISCRKDEYCYKERVDTFNARRKEYFDFVEENEKTWTGSIYELNKKFLMRIVTEFYDSEDGYDKFKILINDTKETIKEWMDYLDGGKSKKPSRVNILNCEKANTIYRWDKELEAMYQQLKDKAKPEGLGPSWLFIHMIPQKYYVNENEVKEFNPNDVNFAKDRRKFAAFVYRSYYGEEGANIYAFNKMGRGRIGKIKPDFYKNVKVLPWNREGEDKLKEIIYKRFDSKLPSKNQQTATQNSLFEDIIKSLFES